MAKLMSAVSEPAAPGVTVLTSPVAINGTNGAAPAATAEKKGSGKSKAELGVPEDWSIAWPSIPMAPERRQLLTSAAKYRNGQLPEGSKLYNLDRLLLDLVEYAIEANIDELTQQAKAAPVTTPKAKTVLDFAKMTPEAAEAAVAKEVANAQKKYNEAQALLKRMREAAAAGTIGTAIPEPEAEETEGETEDDE